MDRPKSVCVGIVGCIESAVLSSSACWVRILLRQLCWCLTQAKLAHVAPVTHVQHALQAFFICIHHQSTTGGHGAHKMVELPLDSCQVVKNICVVELKVVQNRGARAVVDELAAFVKKRSVIFVGFNDKRCALALSFGALRAGLARACLAQACRNSKIQRHAAHQKSRLQTSRFQNPGQHGGGRGFAVCAGNGHHVSRVAGVVQHIVTQPLRSAGVGRTALQNRFHQRKFRCAVSQTCTRHYIAYDIHIGLKLHLVGGKTLYQIDA